MNVLKESNDREIPQQLRVIFGTFQKPSAMFHKDLKGQETGNLQNNLFENIFSFISLVDAGGNYHRDAGKKEAEP